MADTHTIEIERRRETNGEPQGGVEVYDADPVHSMQSNDITTNNGLRDTHGSNDLTNTLRTSDINTANWHNESRTDLEHTEVVSTNQGTNWGTILMVIAVILVVILLGSWLF